MQLEAMCSSSQKIFGESMGVRRHEFYLHVISNKLSDLRQVTSTSELPFEI